MGAVRKIISVEAEGQRGPYLGVAASARGLAWRERQDASAAQIAVAISQRHGLPELLGRVLAARGIGLADVPVFLDPTIKALMPDPSTVRDMDKGAARLADAILRARADRRVRRLRRGRRLLGRPHASLPRRAWARARASTSPTA